MDFFKDISQAKERISTFQSKIIGFKQGKIEYLLKGSGNPILISHGMTGGIDQGLGMVKDFFPKGYKTICVSRFGYLKSSLPNDSSPEDQADAYKELIDKLKISKVFVFGNSAGGPSAIQFAIRHPDRCLGLILHSSTVPLDKPPFTPPKFIMKIVFGSNFIYWFISKYLINFLMLMFVPNSIKKGLNKDQLNHIQEIFTSSLPITLRTKGILNDAFVSNPAINSFKFEEISIPTLILHAKDDPAAMYSGAVKLSKLIPNVKFRTYKKGGHLTLGHEEEIKEEISKFIRSIV